MNYLVNVKKELDNNNLLIYNKFFPNLIKKYKIGVVGYGNLDKFSLSLLPNDTIFYDEKITKKQFCVYHFLTIE